METLNEIKFSMPSLSVNEGAARAVVSSFLIQADPTVEELSDIRTAVSEAVTNAVVHAYRGTKGSIELTVRRERPGDIHKSQGQGMRYSGCRKGNGAAVHNCT